MLPFHQNTVSSPEASPDGMKPSSRKGAMPISR